MRPADDREEVLFREVVKRPNGPEREAYLDQACAGNAALRSRLAALLQAHESPDSFLESPVALPGETVVVSTPPTEKPGDRIGHYKLLQQIGEGGCGVVYMAEQEQPIRRRVALKVIKLGMDSKQVIARFEAERQALALMDHPNIAKVLDAGATGTGRPYFVMELVRGIKITDYCDQNSLSTEQRLELFVQICHAIQHAHQKGIIHRDIKPSNILVTVHDGKPLPKIIDFGIAKAASGQVLTDKTLFTAFEQFIGTPAYMSPEQAELSTLDIDTRSDIYALGVLLYELLTGQTPFDAKELVAAGLNEMRRIIREQEPLRPSTRISTLDLADQTTVARRRHSEPPQLIHLVRGDLDWIVMRCLEKDRTRRYETANGLAADVRRHLGNEPISARPPGRVYRLQKLVRRNKLAFAAASAVAAALVIGLGLSTWLFFRERLAHGRAVAAERTQRQLRREAEDARRQAEANENQAKIEASKSRQVAQFLTNMLQAVGPSYALGRDTTMLREILDKTAERIGKDLTNQPEVEVQLRTTLGGVYEDVGEYAKAEAMYRQALAAAGKRWGNENIEVADILNLLAVPLSKQGKLSEAESLCRDALAMERKLLGNENQQVADTLGNLGWVLFAESKLVESEAVHRESLATHLKVYDQANPERGAAYNDLALTLMQVGKADEAIEMFRRALAILRKAHGPEHPEVATVLHNLGMALPVQCRFDEAETIQREALAMRRKLLGDNHPYVAASRDTLADLLLDEGRFAEAESLTREALAIGSMVTGQGNLGEHRRLALILRDEGKPAEAELEVPMLRKLAAGPEGKSTALYLHCLGLLLRDGGKLTESEETHRQAVAMGKKVWRNGTSPEVARFLGGLAQVIQRQGKLADAEVLFRQALTMSRQMHLNQHFAVAVALNNLAQVLIEQGNFADAESLTRERLLSDRLPLDDWRTYDTAHLHGASLSGQHRDAEALPFLRASFEGMRQQQDKIPAEYQPRLQDAADRLARTAERAGRPDLASELEAVTGSVGHSEPNSGASKGSTVNGPGVSPCILFDPMGQTVPQGASPILRVFALGSPPLSYQWRCGTNDLAGQTNSTLRLAAVTPADTGSYSVVVTNGFGSASSSNSTLSVLGMREAPIAEVNFEDSPPAAYSAFTFCAAPVPLETSVTEAAGAGMNGATGLVMRADGRGFTNHPSQDYSGFGLAVNAFANRTNGINTTDLNSYRLYAMVKTEGVIGTNAHGRVQAQFKTLDGPILTIDFHATFTSNYQEYSYVLGEGSFDPASRGSWAEFIAKFDQIGQVACLITVDDWIGQCRLESGSAIYMSRFKLVRLLPVSSPFQTNSPNETDLDLLHH